MLSRRAFRHTQRAVALSLTRCASRSVLESLELRRLLSAASADTTFDGDGVRTDDFGGPDTAGGTVVQPWDKKVVTVANTPSTGTRLLRYNLDGSLDLNVPLTSFGFDFAIDVATAPGNKLIVVGDQNVNGGDIRVARFNDNGSIDSSFGTLGSTQVDISNASSADSASSVAVRSPNGEVVVGGTSGAEMFVFHLDPTGTLDAGFGVGGIRTVSFGSTAQANRMTLQPNGMALLVGQATNPGGTEDFAMARVSLSGNLDGGFAAGGLFVVSDTTDDQVLNSAVVSSSGDIYAVGVAGGAGVLLHVDSSGALDVGYDAVNSDPLVEVLGAELSANSVVLDSSGRLLIAGVPSTFQFSLSRYNAGGTPDSAFDGDGNVQTAIGTLALSTSVALVSDGRIVVAGQANLGSGDDIAVARYGDAPVSNVITVVPQGNNLVITGTTGNDAVVIRRVTGGLSVEGNNTNFGTFNPIGRIVVTFGGGADQLNVSGSLGVPLFVDGGAGNDTLKGGGGNDIILGGLGNDRLMGANGRDLMIGGDGADRILGQQADDILIAGCTDHDSLPSSLDAIMIEWTSAGTFETRVANLAGILNTTTVHDDLDPDSLNGNAGDDWFMFDGVLDRTANILASEFGPELV